MNTRFSRIVVLLVAFGVAGTLPAQGPRSEKDGHDQMFEHCSKACSGCARVCEGCAAHCGQMVAQGKKEHLRTLQTCQDCATHCVAAAAITARKGPFSDLACMACADACKRCGDECERHRDSQVMKQCAEECRRCERACREMLQHLGKGDQRSKRGEKDTE